MNNAPKKEAFTPMPLDEIARRMLAMPVKTREEMAKPKPKKRAKKAAK